MKSIAAFCAFVIPFLILASAVPIRTSRAQGPAAPPAQVEKGFLYKTVQVDGAEYAYCVYVPPQYTPERPWPAILFLHGSGERGADGFLQTDVGIARVVRRNRNLVPAIIVMPQCQHTQSWISPKMMKMSLKALEDVSRNYHVDHDRLYLTGLSMGGQGVWAMASRLPDAFAAIVPICGFGEPDDITSLSKVPTWAFHGSADRNVPVEGSRMIIEAIKKAGGSPRYTEIPGGDHFIWDRVYDDAALWQWLFSQKRGVKGG